MPRIAPWVKKSCWDPEVHDGFKDIDEPGSPDSEEEEETSSPSQHEQEKDKNKDNHNDPSLSDTPEATPRTTQNGRKAKKRRTPRYTLPVIGLHQKSEIEAKMNVWRPKFEQLREYKNAHGHCRVPVRYENQALARWVKKMRADYKKYQNGECTLLEEQITKLNDLGFEWGLRAVGRTWETNMKDLRAYKKENGNCLVPMNYEENQPLASWVKSVRQAYKKYQKGEKSSLTAKQVASLNKLGFEWKLRAGRNQSKTGVKWIPWEKRIAELKAYKEAHGDCQVPSNWEENQSLSTWVYNTKYQYGKLQNGEKTALTPERVAELDSLGFDWEIPGGFRAGRSEPRKIILWETHVDHLKEFKKEYGHCRVPRNFEENRTLGIWVSNTRQEYAKLKRGEKSPLTEKRITQLNRLGFEWTPGDNNTQDSGNETTLQRGKRRKSPRKQPAAKKQRTKRKTRHSSDEEQGFSEIEMEDSESEDSDASYYDD